MNRILQRIISLSACIGLIFDFSFAQEKPAVKEKTEATINLSYFKKADLKKTAVAIIKIKNKEEKFVPAKDVKVNFYTQQNKEQRLLQSVNTNSKGEAKIELKEDLLLDENHFFNIIAKIENNELYEDAEEEIHYKDGNLVIRLDPKDTLHLATASITELNKEGKEIPVANTAIKFYVQRMFGIMAPVESNSVNTDEQGEAMFNYPKNIPGDTAGAYSVVARIEDNDTLGNIEGSAETRWGTMLVIESNPFPRALWAPRAPIPMILTFSILFGGVWITYFFIFFQMRKIKKEINAQIN